MNLFSAGPTSGDCTFEHGSCHWNNTAVSDMPWFLREGKTGSVNTGPSVDHTTGTSSGKVPAIFCAVVLFLSWLFESPLTILDLKLTMFSYLSLGTFQKANRKLEVKKVQITV